MAFDPVLDHLDASLQDFEPSIGSPRQKQQQQQFGYPSAHSGFSRSSHATSENDEELAAVLSEAEDDDDEMNGSAASAGGYSPPAWRRLGNGDRSSGFWRKSDNFAYTTGGGGNGDNSAGANNHYHPNFARGASPEYEGDEILRRAMHTRLPAGSVSPEKERSPEPEWHPAQVKIEEDLDENMKRSLAAVPKEVAENYIRFAVRAEVQQRTEPIEAAISYIQQRFGVLTRTWMSLLVSILVAVMAIGAMRNLFQPPAPRPVPDLVKVAGIARSFEPLIYYSENGVQQVGDLQATGVAVWDLGESVRSSNMTSAPLIVKELDELSDSLKTLAIELTRFFANVDGDIDSILIVMDWARRELSQVQTLPPPVFSSAFDNVHNMLSTAGILEDSAGAPTTAGVIATKIFGMSNPQRTRQALERTFKEFLAVLEEAINNELQHSLALFGLFEAIDQQFLNLARTVVRESSLQDEMHGELLSSLWTRILGPNASEVKKYERNRLLLQNVREKTVRNKGILIEHNHRLLALKANLENLRRKLVSPLVRSVNSSTLTIEEQMRGLEDVGLYLEGVRARQKSKLMEMLYGSSGGGAAAAVGGGSRRMIEDSAGAREQQQQQARWV